MGRTLVLFEAGARGGVDQRGVRTRTPRLLCRELIIGRLGGGEVRQGHASPLSAPGGSGQSSKPAVGGGKSSPRARHCWRATMRNRFGGSWMGSLDFARRRSTSRLGITEKAGTSQGM